MRTRAVGRGLPPLPASPPTGRTGLVAVGRVRAFAHRLRESWRAQVELQDAAGSATPWEEELLHWSCVDGGVPQMHGHRVPPHGRRAATTETAGVPDHTLDVRVEQSAESPATESPPGDAGTRAQPSGERSSYANRGGNRPVRSRTRFAAVGMTLLVLVAGTTCRPRYGRCMSVSSGSDRC